MITLWIVVVRFKPSDVWSGRSPQDKGEEVDGITLSTVCHHRVVIG